MGEGRGEMDRYNVNGTWKAFSILIAFFTLLFLSCSSISPVSVPTEKIAEKTDIPEHLIPHWYPFASDITPGLDYCEENVQNPKLQLWALRVDLTAPSLRFVVNKKEPVNGVMKDSIIPSTKITSFVQQYDCLAGINTTPFSPVTGKEGEARNIVGITISDGIVIAPPHPSYDGLVFYGDGSAAIVNQAQLKDLDQIDNAVGGFFRVLEKGVIAQRLQSGAYTARHPRSAVGISEDGKTLYLLVIDGRRIGSIGATEAEIAIILKQLGAFDGLNFDGGGSTALALRYPDGRIRAVNTPIHGGIPKQERGVASCLGIKVFKEDV
jgi:hypothetical protein